MKSKPNVVLVMTDQQRADLSKREGFAADTTPFLDELARRGVWFKRAYTATPACGPARVSLLTGRYPSATRVRTNHNLRDATFSHDLFDVFRAQGYATGLSGKNHSHLTRDKADFWFEAHHLGAENPTPSEKQFDDFLAGTHFHMHREAAPFPLECQLPYRIVDKAQEWIQSIEAQPFFLWLSFPEPHNPFQVCEPYYSMFEDAPLPTTDKSSLNDKSFAWRFNREGFETAFPDFQETLPRARANYLGMLRLIDDQIRRFVTFLQERGQWENTIFVFLSDHGDFVGEYGLLRKGPELPEVLTRIPLQFCGPQIQPQIEANTAHVSLVDIFSTLCDAIGAPVPIGVQGRNLWPLLTGAAYDETLFSSVYAEHGFGGSPYDENDADLCDPQRDGLTPAADDDWGAYDCLNSRTQTGTTRMIRRDDWKLIMDNTGRVQLFNLKTDPLELNNLADDADSQIQRHQLTAELLQWCLRVADPLPLPRHRYVFKTPH